jgi:threonine aldolase
LLDVSRKWSAWLSYLDNHDRNAAAAQAKPLTPRAFFPARDVGSRRPCQSPRRRARGPIEPAIWEHPMNFASDNGAGVAPEILDAIVASSRVNAPAYGADDYTIRARARLDEIFERKVDAFLVPTGTGANALALAALARPWEAIFCHEEAHINEDECGAPEFFTAGAKLVGMPGLDGKLTAEILRETLGRYPRGLVKASQPGALSLSQATEAGTLYSVAEITALASIARDAGLATHMDGARFANAIARLGVSPAEMTWRAGVDALSFGATKNGALACEAVVFFDSDRAASFAFQRKRGGHTLSKGRVLGAQMEAYLADGLWLRLAARANAAASELAAGLLSAPDVRKAWPTEANEVFVVAPSERAAAWRAAGARFYDWPTRSLAGEFAPRSGETLLRLVTSFDTSRAEIDALVALARSG